MGTIKSGKLTANDDDTFDVVLTLEMTQPTSAMLTFTGLLDHSGLDEFPPTIPTFIGNISP